MAFIRAISSLEKARGSARGDEKIGVDIVKRALEEPLRQISNNAGVEGAIVVQKVAAGKGAFGFNADSETYEDMIKAGVLDPTKVARSALENAASIAGLLLTTEVVVADIPEKEPPAPPAPPGGGMY